MSKDYLHYQIGVPGRNIKAHCDVCGKSLVTEYCTVSVCEVCCKAGKCPCETFCESRKQESKLSEKMRNHVNSLVEEEK